MIGQSSQPKLNRKPVKRRTTLSGTVRWPHTTIAAACAAAAAAAAAVVWSVRRPTRGAARRSFIL